MDAVISCPKEKRDLAEQLIAKLRERKFEAVLTPQERSPTNLFPQALLRRIRDNRAMLLLWSAEAAQDRWVRAEWLAAFHEQRFIIPCALDDAPFPHFLTDLRPIDMRPGILHEFDALERTIRESPPCRNPMAAVEEAAGADIRQIIHTIACSQVIVLTMLGEWRLHEAGQEQQRTLSSVKKALSLAPSDPMVTKLAGFHYKNQYWVENGEALKTGHLPLSPLLGQAESCFFQTLEQDPTDAEALNGLGGTLMLNSDFDGAEYLQRKAIQIVEGEGQHYVSAERDLERTRAFRMMSRPRSTRPPPPRRSRA